MTLAETSQASVNTRTRQEAVYRDPRQPQRLIPTATATGRITVYVKTSKRVVSKDGDFCVSVFFRPDSYQEEPYSRIATGDYKELVKKWGIQKAKIAILMPLINDLTHYFQWLNGEKLTLIGEKRQATVYTNALIEEYMDDMDS